MNEETVLNELEPAAVEPEVEPEQPDGEPPEAEDELVVQIGDEEPAQEAERAPDWVRDLRRQHRELQRQNRELQAKLQTVAPQQQLTLGPKPTLESVDYDSAKFEQELEAWYTRKREVDSVRERAKRAEEEQTQAWQSKLEQYGKAKQELRVKDYDEAEALVQETMSTVQQGVILQGAENPALLVYALGRNPKRAKELAAITDPVKFAVAIGKLEKDMKVTPRKAPPPESTVRSGTPASANDSTLNRLRAEAERTGDMTKVIAYRRQMREKESARR